jgi:homoaconitase/3-isopropylmalate dehydratase large subunit
LQELTAASLSGNPDKTPGTRPLSWVRKCWDRILSASLISRATASLSAQRFGIWYSRAGNGVSHPVHQERFGKPGKTMLGSDSHTSAAGAIGMLAIGAGGLEVAMATAGEPFYVELPSIWGIRLAGTLPDWVSAKDAAEIASLDRRLLAVP